MKPSSQLVTITTRSSSHQCSPAHFAFRSGGEIRSCIRLHCGRLTPKKPGVWAVPLCLLYVPCYCSTRTCHPRQWPSPAPPTTCKAVAQITLCIPYTGLQMSALATTLLNKRIWTAAEQHPAPATVLTSKACFLFAHFKATTSISSWVEGFQSAWVHRQHSGE